MSDHLIVGKYVSIPEKTLRSKDWRDLKAYSRAVYTTMGLRYMRTGKSADGRVTWTQPELVEQSGLPLRTVQRGVQELRRKEFVSVWEPGGRWQQGTTYEMNPKYMDGKPKGYKGLDE